MANAKRVDETVEADDAPLVDRIEQITHRRLAVPIDILQPDRLVARLQSEDVGGLPHPFLLVEEFDLLLS